MSDEGGRLAPLRNREFRLIAFGSMVSQLGTWQQYVAMLWLARLLTEDTFLITVVFAAQWIPFILLSPFTGVVADLLDRRSLLLWTNVAMVFPALALGLLTDSGHIGLAGLAALIMAGNAAQALSQPAAAAFIPSLVPPSQLQAAVALNMGLQSSTRVIGPAIGGVIVRTMGVEWGFYFNAVSFLAVAFACLFVESRGRPPSTGDEGYLRSIAIGLRYLRENRAAMRILLLLTTVAFFFVHAPLLPSLVKDVLDGDAGTYGTLSSAPGTGFVLAAFIAVALATDAGRVRVMFLSAFAGGVATVVIGVSRDIPVTFLGLVLFGVAYMTLNTLSSTLLLATSDDEYRGRVMGIYGMVGIGIFAINALTAGAVARVLGVPETIWLGGAIAMSLTVAHLLSGASSVIRTTLDERRERAAARELTLPSDDAGAAGVEGSA